MICRLGAGVLLASLTAAISVGQEFIETFEAGIPASWTIDDNFPIPGSPDFSAVPWTTNIAEGLLNYTNGGLTTGVGTAATASSKNHPGQYDISLITPVFHVTASDVAFSYTINLQRVDAFEAFDTNLIINGGAPLVMTHDTSSLGPAYSTGAPKITRGIGLGFFGVTPADSLRVEFRYYSTFLLPMVRNEYVQIDNVRFPTAPVPEPGAISLAIVPAVLALAHRRKTLSRRTNDGPSAPR
jgi:hypothetical protein